MKAIQTKYHGPTNTRGARISAHDHDGNRATIPYPYELSGEAVHRKAADRLCEKMQWSGEMVGGAVKGGYVFVFTSARAIAAGACWCGCGSAQPHQEPVGDFEDGRGLDGGAGGGGC